MRICFSRSRLLIIVWLLLNIADMIFTIAVVGAGGFEALPVARLFLEWKPISFILFKIIAPLSILPLLYWFGHFHLLRLLNVLLGIIVIWNMVLFIVLI